MLEQTYRKQGFRYIFGIDEAGRGPMAGPLVAATVCLPLDDFESLRETLKGVKDSKEMTFRQRERAFDLIQEVAITCGIGEVTADEMPIIGNMTIVTIKAMQRALEAAFTDKITKPDILLVDYLHLPDYDDVPQESLTRGENQSLSIAAASVLAKVYRDRKMIEFAEKFPAYGFEKHKGYITAAHKSALFEYGPCEIHRTNYSPVQLATQRRIFD
jgi:ribonuclease HII